MVINMDEGLQTALMFLSYTCVILFTVLAVFIIMLLKDLMELIKSYKTLADTIQKEIYPTLEEIKKALEGINGLASGVDKHLSAVKSSFTTAYDIAFNAASKFKGASLALLGGLLAGIKFFLKK